VSSDIDCLAFRRRVFEFQHEELGPDEREALQGHLDACPACARRLQAEDGMLRCLQSVLKRSPAPAGLETRLRACLEAETPRRTNLFGWLFSPAFAAAAAAVLLALILVPGWVPTGAPPLAVNGAVRVAEELTLVDLDCDLAGADTEYQRHCRDPLHINALKTAGGEYWQIAAERREFRRLLLEPSLRGRRFHVEGYYHPGLRTVYPDRVRELGPVQTAVNPL